MRRKLIAVLIAGLAVAIPAAPAVVGWQTDRMYHDIVAQMDAQNEDISVRVDEYEVGWLESSSEYTIELGGPWAEALAEASDHDGPIRIHGRDHIRHGPWTGDGFGAARLDSQWRIPEVLRALGQEEIADQAVVNARSDLDSQGRLDSRFYLRDYAFTLTPDAATDQTGPLTVEWADASGRARIDGADTRVLATVPTFRLESSEGDALVLREFEVGDRSRRASDGLWLGRAHLAIGEVDLNVASAERAWSLNVADLSLANEAEVSDDETVVADSRFGFGELQSDQLTLGEAEIRTRATGLDREPLARLQGLLDEAQATVRDEGPNGSGLDELDREVREAFGDVLRGSPRVQTERLDIETPDGAITGDLDLRFDGERPFDPSLAVSMIDPIAGDFELRIPTDFARRLAYASLAGEFPQGDLSAVRNSDQGRQINQAINILVGTRLIQRDGDHLIFHIDKDSGGPPLINNQDIMSLVQALSGLLE